ncbi:Bug family tripartite tricarboxylate transporter substrate binding protein [Propylenella binzhouense]|uniref:Tripartite tricarboxylate transporter substrate binding protein n=1 Tax=Propylenella binzhouense TaxID=2555902 RepID=A0A964T8C8_9HYPH|nr:tripartite tricarboxylate transporter substrate binding protein [Propylenella binzhouense]MYZ49945.1 tripartite tricarboxylate transporter substrate binding protein [Propylenella binzhouense]
MNRVSSMLKSALAAGALAAALALPVASAGPADAQDYPSKRLEWTIAFGPGGGNDIMSRTLIDILQKHKLYPENIVAENRAGGSGAVGWGYVFGKKGDPYQISSTSGSFVTTPLQADTPWKPTDFTPIALLASDDLVLLVKGDSEIETVQQFIEAAKKKPPTIGGIGAVNVDFIIPKILSKQAGFDFDYVSFNAAGELNTALLSNSLDAIMANPGEVLGLIESKDMRPLAYSGETTPPALGDVPTLKEAGYEIGVSLPRGLILPPDVPKEAQDWWIETIKKVVETPEWKDYLEKQILTENIRYGEDFRTFLKTTQDRFAEILREQGAIK